MPTRKKPSEPRAAKGGDEGAAKPSKPTRKRAGGSTRPKKKLPDGMSMDEMTRIRAFEIWEARQASEADDWKRAEAEVRSEYREP